MFIAIGKLCIVQNTNSLWCRTWIKDQTTQGVIMKVLYQKQLPITTHTRRRQTSKSCRQNCHRICLAATAHVHHMWKVQQCYWKTRNNPRITHRIIVKCIELRERFGILLPHTVPCESLCAQDPHRLVQSRTVLVWLFTKKSEGTKGDIIPTGYKKIQSNKLEWDMLLNVFHVDPESMAWQWSPKEFNFIGNLFIEEQSFSCR